VCKFVVAGTGSRSLQSSDLKVKQAVCEQIRLNLLDLYAKWGSDLIVMSGMAEGFDKALAVVAMQMRLPLWCAIPNKGYSRYYWGKKSLTGKDQCYEFDAILHYAMHITYVMEDIHNTDSLYLNGLHSNFVRNNYMVEQAEYFLVYNPESAGTRQCLSQIKKANKPYKILEVPNA